MKKYAGGTSVMYVILPQPHVSDRARNSDVLP
jgi:hypothetical protein